MGGLGGMAAAMGKRRVGYPGGRSYLIHDIYIDNDPVIGNSTKSMRLLIQSTVTTFTGNINMKFALVNHFRKEETIPNRRTFRGEYVQFGMCQIRLSNTKEYLFTSK